MGSQPSLIFGTPCWMPFKGQKQPFLESTVGAIGISHERVWLFYKVFMKPLSKKIHYISKSYTPFPKKKLFILKNYKVAVCCINLNLLPLTPHDFAKQICDYLLCKIKYWSLNKSVKYRKSKGTIYNFMSTFQMYQSATPWPASNNDGFLIST